MKKIKLFRGFLTTQMNHWVFASIGLTAMGFNSTGSMKDFMLRFILLGILPFALYLSRMFTDKFIPFILLHMAAAACAFCLFVYVFIGSLLPLIVFSVYIAAYVIISFVLRVNVYERSEKPLHPAMALAVLAGMQLVQRYFLSAGADAYYAVIFIVYVVMYLICLYLRHFERLVADSSSAAGHVPRQTIFKTGIKMTGIYIAAAVLCFSLIAGISSLYGVFDGIGRERREYDYDGDAAYYETFPMFEPGSLFPDDELEPQSPPGPRVNMIMTVIASIILGAAVIFALAAFAAFIWNRFQQVLDIKTQPLEDDIDVHEKISAGKSKTERSRLPGFLSYRARIRRIYKKRVLDEKKRIIKDDSPEKLGLLTARECGRLINADILADIYEKARYSAEECRPEDVKAAKAAKAK